MTTVPGAAATQISAADPYAPAGTGPAGPAGPRPGATRGASRPAAVPGLPAQPPGRWPATRIVAMTREFVGYFLEVESGRRPRRQLEPFLTPMLYARLSTIWVRGGCPGHVVNVTLVSRTAGCCDLVAIVRRGERCGSLSLRLLRVPRRGWLVDVVARPEDGYLPPPAYPVATDEPDEGPVEIPAVAVGDRGAEANWLVRG